MTLFIESDNFSGVLISDLRVLAIAFVKRIFTIADEMIIPNEYSEVVS